MASPSDFFERMMPYAQQVSQRTGIDPRLVLAQAALETGYGRSAPNNNFFGIKSHGRGGGNTLQTQEFEGGRMVSVPQSFRGYESPEQSFMDYADFITSNPRYRPVLEAKDLEGQIRAMAASGYATDPDYGTKLAQIAGVADPNARANISTQGGQQMAIMEQQPQGLLGALGIQRRDPTAQGETALPFYQRETFGNTLDNVMLALNSMTLRPDPNLAQQIGQRRQERTSAKQRNATLEYLRNLNTPRAQEALQYGEATGDIAGALKIAMDRPDAPTPQSAIAKLEADRRAGLIDDEQYQTGLQALAPSGMVIESDGAGGFRMVQGPGAGATKPLTEGQSKDTVYATRAEGALPILDQNEAALTSLGDVALGADPTGILRGRMQSGEYQLARQAGDEFLQAVLRKDTGAAITAQEQELYGKTYLPQPGDSQEVIAQKRQSRRRALEAIKAGLPPSAIIAQERALQASEPAAPAGNRIRYDAQGNRIP